MWWIGILGGVCSAVFHESLQITFTNYSEHLPRPGWRVIPEQLREITYSVALFHLPRSPIHWKTFRRKVEWPQRKTEIASGGGNRGWKTCEGGEFRNGEAGRKEEQMGGFKSKTTSFPKRGGNTLVRQSHLLHKFAKKYISHYLKLLRKNYLTYRNLSQNLCWPWNI